ncbi:MAG: helix-turn-helix domain-containing protein [Rhodothermales bacterium]|nr:helix-turn-helix domain-containing protein [Rhodothermales bacterium]
MIGSTVSLIDQTELLQAVRQEIRSEFDALRQDRNARPLASTSDILTERQACEYTRLSRSTLQRARRRGALTTVGVGRTIRYRRGDLDALLLAGAKPTSAVAPSLRGRTYSAGDQRV